jgi:hypothetical protein
MWVHSTHTSLSINSLQPAAARLLLTFCWPRTERALPKHLPGGCTASSLWVPTATAAAASLLAL